MSEFDGVSSQKIYFLTNITPFDKKFVILIPYMYIFYLYGIFDSFFIEYWNYSDKTRIILFSPGKYSEVLFHDLMAK